MVEQSVFSHETVIPRWYVVQTQPHAETKAIFNLKQQSFEIFCPWLLKNVRHARKVRKVQVPLFPGYVFLSMDIAQTQWRRINSTFGVMHLIMQGSRPQAVPLSVIDTLRSRVDDNGVVNWSNNLHVGQMVRISRGAFADWVGPLEYLDARGRVQVLLAIMGREVNVSLHVSCLVPVE